ncbi:MAG: DUF547 domain-containing protein [Verrucomicrobia bacterium]|nr:DUF547 domain-containing protein [Verrucomicrobiota bacterium]
MVTFALALALAHTAEFDQTHAAFDGLLKKHVRDGWVDYAALKADLKPLNAYLDSLAAVSEKDFNRWPEKERFAFLINLYNATTLKLIVDHYPVKSIKDIGGFLSGPWKQEVVRLFGRATTLSAVEHNIIRAQFHEPRVHFALVCAAKGCPALRAEAYLGTRLDEQLDDQGRVFLAQAQKNRVDAGARVIFLSPIFKWFAEDFEAKSGSVLAFVKPYLPENARRAVEQDGFKIKYTDYDWSLNDLSRKKNDR